MLTSTSASRPATQILGTSPYGALVAALDVRAAAGGSPCSRQASPAVGSNCLQIAISTCSSGPGRVHRFISKIALIISSLELTDLKLLFTL